MVGDCLDPSVVDEAVAGVDVVVHLAGNPDEDSLPASLASHVHTTGRLLDAMVTHGVRRIVYASSNHAVGRTERSELLTTSVPRDPTPSTGSRRSRQRRC
ncbi:NAD-dependent epimerase/dehydratase family protein [Aeromicrobium sp. UC242_57]|uniref:NAD-dependent epimerase/dehydratase family protein n=1 Tax=Aeromicrobium sp. UC242_57 TaxID=3374624 RepID=UPI0037ACF26C